MVRVKKGRTEIGITFDNSKEDFVIGDKKKKAEEKIMVSTKNVKVGGTITRITKNGRKVTLKRVKKTGNLQFKIIKNEKA